MMKFLGLVILLTNSLLASEPAKKLGFCFQSYVRSCEVIDQNQAGQCTYEYQTKRILKELDEDGAIHIQNEMQYEDIAFTYEFFYNAKRQDVSTLIITKNDRIKPFGFDVSSSAINIKRIEELRHYDTLGGLILSESGDMIVAAYTSISYIPEDQPEFCTLGKKKIIPLK